MLITLINASSMSASAATVMVMLPKPRAMLALISTTPGVRLNTSSWGSMICDSISAGAAWRQLVNTEICGRCRLGRSWTGRLSMASRPKRPTTAMTTASAAGLRSEYAVRFIDEIS